MHYSVHKEDDPTVKEEPTVKAEVQIWLCWVSLGALAAPGLFCEPCEKGQRVQLPVSVSTVSSPLQAASIDRDCDLSPHEHGMN